MSEIYLRYLRRSRAIDILKKNSHSIDSTALLVLNEIAVEHFDGKTLSYDDFVINANLKQKESAGYLFSKYINMKFIDIFLSANGPTRNKIATDFLRYAASNTDQSSFFVKIS